MITRVLFVDTDARALARIKKALEQAGPYEASVFVTGGAALEHAADQPPALAVIALNLTDMPPTELVERLRAIVPDLPVLLRAPADTDRQILGSIGAYGIVEGGYTARTLIPLLSEALDDAPPRPRAAQPSPTVPPLESILPTVQRDQSPRSGHPDDDMSAFDEILESIEPSLPQSEEDSFHLLVESMRGQQQRPPLPKRHERLVQWAEGARPAPPETPPPSDLFAQLSADEPPVPEIEDSGTVSDLIDITNFRHEREDSPVADIPDEMILAFEELSETDEQRDLLKALSAMDQPPSREIDLDSVPDRLKPTARPAAEPAAQDAAAPDAAAHDAVAEEPAAAEESAVTPPAGRQQLSLADLASPPTEPAEDSQDWRGSEAAALALELTEQTLDSAAQASVLVRDGQIVASAGELAQAELEALVQIVDCDRVLEEQTTRLKLIALPELRLSYMVAAAPSVDNLVLLTIFPENMQLGAIHSQARSIMRALDAAEAAAAETALAAHSHAAAEEEDSAGFAAESRNPQAYLSGAFEAQAEGAPDGLRQSAPETPPAAGPEPGPDETILEVDRTGLVSYACAWLLRDPAGELTADIVQVLPAWLHQAAAAQGWFIEQLDVQPDYVSLVIGIAADDTPAAMAEALMAESARRISAAHPGYGAPALIWADAYYVVTPGRPLTAPEISQFMSYQRQQ